MSYIKLPCVDNPGYFFFFFLNHTFCKGSQANSYMSDVTMLLHCRRSNMFCANHVFYHIDTVVAFYPCLFVWHKWDGEQVLVTKFGWKRFRNFEDMSLKYWKKTKKERRNMKKTKPCRRIRERKEEMNKKEHYMTLRLRRQGKYAIITCGSLIINFSMYTTQREEVCGLQFENQEPK